MEGGSGSTCGSRNHDQNTYYKNISIFKNMEIFKICFLPTLY